MESHKTYQAINPVELAKISQELIVKNKTAYKHLATGLPVQQILDEIIPQLIKLYKGHVVQIVQFETDLSCINLAVLFDDSYTKEMHQAKIGKIHKAINSINDKKDIPIILYCHSGSRSAYCQRIMLNMGFSKVINLGLIFLSISNLAKLIFSNILHIGKLLEFSNEEQLDACYKKMKKLEERLNSDY